MSDCLILYHIPSDRDDVDIPNAFVIPKPPDQVTLQDIHDSFPLPGEYHFRVKHGNNFWLDLRPGQSLPVSGKRIVLKALRINWQKSRPAMHATQAAPQAAPPAAPQTVDSFDAFFG